MVYIHIRNHVVLALCSGNFQRLPNPAFNPATALGATEEKTVPIKNETETDGGKDEKESLKDEKESLKDGVISTLV